MPIELNIEEGKLLVFDISGKLGKDEHQRILAEIESIIHKVGNIKILARLKNFNGWEASKGWEQASTENVDPYISKFAIVGDEKWRDLVTVFTLKGLRPVPIEYFADTTDEAARQWLASDQ